MLARMNLVIKHMVFICNTENCHLCDELLVSFTTGSLAIDYVTLLELVVRTLHASQEYTSRR